MSELKMPSFGADMDAGTLVQWYVKPGDRVARGDIVAVIETQKGAIDMEVFDAGTIDALLVQEGEKVPVGTPIASIDSGSGVAQASAEAAAAPAESTAPSAPAVGKATGQAPGPRIKASPRARVLARAGNLDLARISGSGPAGAILEADVEHALGKPQPPAGTAKQGPFEPAGMRRAIAAAMSRSKREIPHYYLEHSIDISKAQDWLQAHNAERTPEQRLLLGALLVRAAALTLKQTPELNGYYSDGRFDPSPAVHIGMAISIRGGGLVVPALLDADHASLEQLMERLKDLTGRARHGGLRSSEMSAATVTLTSLGDRGVDSVLGVIFPPQVAILGFGTPVLRPWITDTGSVEARPVLRVTLAADHRVSDGHLGARFLRELARKLQSPESL